MTTYLGFEIEETEDGTFEVFEPLGNSCGTYPSIKEANDVVEYCWAECMAANAELRSGDYDY